MAITLTKASKTDGKSKWESLSDRERYGLVGLVAFLFVLLTIVGVAIFQQQMAEIEDKTRAYESALDLLATAGPAYAQRLSDESAQGTHKNIDSETLAKNDIKLTSFVADHAEKTNITVSSYDEDQLPFGNKKDGGPIIVEKQLRVEIRKAQMADMMQLLDRIERSPEPVFVKRLDIRDRGKVEGEVRAVLTISTFVRKDQES